MIIYEWVGKADDVLPFSVTQVGTGQSGTVAIVTTANNVLTNAQAIKITQQTSGGAGNVQARLVIPRPIGYERFRYSWVYRLLNDDADFSHVRFEVTDFDGTDGEEYALFINSNFGSTEEIQYLTTGEAQDDTGLFYPPDMGIDDQAWSSISYDINVSDKKYTRQTLNSDYSLASRDSYSPGSYPGETGIYTYIKLLGTTTACAILIDSFTVETLE